MKINEEAIDKFVENFDMVDYKKQMDVKSYPLKFDNLSTEINFHATRILLHFGSGYDVEMQKICGKNYSETILFGKKKFLSGKKIIVIMRCYTFKEISKKNLNDKIILYIFIFDGNKSFCEKKKQI